MCMHGGEGLRSLMKAAIAREASVWQLGGWDLTAMLSQTFIFWGFISPFGKNKNKKRLWVYSLSVLQKKLKNPQTNPTEFLAKLALITFRISHSPCVAKARKVAQRAQEFCILWKFPCGDEWRENRGIERRWCSAWVSINGQNHWIEAKDFDRTQHSTRREHRPWQENCLWGWSSIFAAKDWDIQKQWAFLSKGGLGSLKRNLWWFGFFFPAPRNQELFAGQNWLSKLCIIKADSAVTLPCSALTSPDDRRAGPVASFREDLGRCIADFSLCCQGWSAVPIHS